jgi:imidazole glycerol-phosphate synthase subunit HisH
MIVIIDYDMGNIGSIENMIRKVGGSSIVSRDPAVIEQADKIVLPGVGAFDTGMENIARFNLRSVLDYKVLEERVPLLGICLGMQLLTRGSEEGTLPGLGWIDAKTVRFPSAIGEQKLRIPHMGWNSVRAARQDPFLEGLDEAPRFYFVHSYYVSCDYVDTILGETKYGIQFTSIVRRDNVIGTQFHPEKSHRFGMKLIENFVHKLGDVDKSNPNEKVSMIAANQR